MKAKCLILLVICTLCWGGSYFFIKIAVSEIPPLTLACLRAIVACVVLFGVCLMQRQVFFDWKRLWRNYVILGVTLNALPWLLVNLSELYISSSLAGILSSLILIFTAILSHYFGTHDPFTKNKLLGVVFGIVGFATIYLPMILKEGVGNGIGILFMILSCLVFGIGTVYARTHLQKNVSVNATLTAQLGMAAILLLPVALFIDGPSAILIHSYQALGSVICLGVIVTALGFLLFYKLIQLAGATYASFATLLIPLPAMFLGVYFLNEVLAWNIYIGTFLILTGVLFVNPAFNNKKA
jgi:drug/metabolite transporter (DMT)-like permease